MCVCFILQGIFDMLFVMQTKYKLFAGCPYCSKYVFFPSVFWLIDNKSLGWCVESSSGT